MDKPMIENVNGRITVRGPLALVAMPLFWLFAMCCVLVLVAVACITAPFVLIGKVGRKLGRKAA